jgi:hypothetical protein
MINMLWGMMRMKMRKMGMKSRCREDRWIGDGLAVIILYSIR